MLHTYSIYFVLQPIIIFGLTGFLCSIECFKYFFSRLPINKKLNKFSICFVFQPSIGFGLTGALCSIKSFQCFFFELLMNKDLLECCTPACPSINIGRPFGALHSNQSFVVWHSSMSTPIEEPVGGLCLNESLLS